MSSWMQQTSPLYTNSTNLLTKLDHREQGHCPSLKVAHDRNSTASYIVLAINLFRFLVPVIITFTYACFFIASSIGPGEINANNVRRALEVYPYDHLLFDPKTCGTCKIPK
jgi:hypothetical protein